MWLHENKFGVGSPAVGEGQTTGAGQAGQAGLKELITFWNGWGNNPNPNNLSLGLRFPAGFTS